MQNRIQGRAGAGKSPVMPCGCAKRDGTYGYVFNDAGEPKICPICNGSGSTDPDYQPRFKAYTITPTTPGQTFLTASTSQEGVINVDASYDFCCIWITASSTSITANVQGGGFTLELWDQSKQRPWQDAPLNIGNIAGTGQRPFPVGLVPQRTPATWNIPWRVADYSAANNTIQVVLSGYEMVPIVQTAAPLAG